MEANYRFPGNVSRGSVQMFDNSVIGHEVNRAGVAGESTNRCNLERLRLDIRHEWTRVF